MNLTHAPDYAIRLITSPTSDTIPKSEVLIANMPTGTVVDGAVFEAALRWQDRTLLFLTDDVPFEDGLNIYLLDTELNVIDQAHMYHAYSTGIFANLDLTQADTVRFSFFGKKVWALTLFSEKKFALPYAHDPVGVSRPFKFFRQFQLDDHPAHKISQTPDTQAQRIH